MEAFRTAFVYVRNVFAEKSCCKEVPYGKICMESLD